MPPTFGNGKICYVEIPATDIGRSPGEAVVASGGQVAQPIGAEAPEITAKVLDPAGDALGLHQQRGGR